MALLETGVYREGMDLLQLMWIVPRKIKSMLDEMQLRTVTARYDFKGYKRIYLVHIRKTGGTSLNHSFLMLAGEDTASLYKRLGQEPDHRLLSNGKVYVGWNVPYINRGNYFYAFSHVPLHALNLPEQTFTVTCFRDPVRRVLSHYNMLMEYQLNKVAHPCMPIEGKWLGNSFDDFLGRIPREHLCNQLYMFSARYDIGEALDRVKGLSHVFFAEDFGHGVEALNKKTGLALEVIHTRKTSYKADISQRGLDDLREMLREEYEFLRYVREMRQGE
jgi:hypothetical protein